MTIKNLKKMDKRLREIQDPLGTGFPQFRRIMEDWAKECGLSVRDVGNQYMAWKWKK